MNFSENENLTAVDFGRWSHRRRIRIRIKFGIFLIGRKKKKGGAMAASSLNAGLIGSEVFPAYPTLHPVPQMKKSLNYRMEKESF